MSLLSRYLGPKQAFEGGLFLPDQKAEYARQPIETLPVDGPLHVPLSHMADWSVEPVVRVGDRVLHGSLLSEPSGSAGLPVHSPVSGRVTAFSRAWTPYDGLVPCVTIEPDERNEVLSSRHGFENESVIVQLARHGVMCQSPRAALHEYLHAAIARGVGDLIINAMETEPYLAADLRTVVEEPGRIVDTACELADALGVVRAIIAVPFRHRRVVRRLNSEAEGRGVEIVALADVYPQCSPVLLVKSLLDREIPPGGAPLDVGVVVLPLSSIRSAAHALLDDRPVTHAVMTVAGDAIRQPGVFRVAIGTPIERLANRLGLASPMHQVVFGGPLTGVSVDNLSTVVTSECTGALFFKSRESVSPVPCIRCGWCVEDCPIGIAPTDFLKSESRSAASAMVLLQADACIDCGLCTHVCPSQIPLAKAIRDVRGRRPIQSQPAGATP